MRRCAICGHIGGHDKLTHRNQILAEWWPLYNLRGGSGSGSHHLLQVNRAEDVPRHFIREAERIVELELGSQISPGVM